MNNIWRHFGARPELGVGEVETCEFWPNKTLSLNKLNVSFAGEFGEKIPVLPSQDGGAVFRVIEFSPEGPWIDTVCLYHHLQQYDIAEKGIR